MAVRRAKSSNFSEVLSTLCGCVLYCIPQNLSGSNHGLNSWALSNKNSLINIIKQGRSDDNFTLKFFGFMNIFTIIKNGDIKCWNCHWSGATPYQSQNQKSFFVSLSGLKKLTGGILPEILKMKPETTLLLAPAKQVRLVEKKNCLLWLSRCTLIYMTRQREYGDKTNLINFYEPVIHLSNKI